MPVTLPKQPANWTRNGRRRRRTDATGRMGRVTADDSGQDLPANPRTSHRWKLSIPSKLLELCVAGPAAPWSMAWWMDVAVANLPMPSLGKQGRGPGPTSRLIHPSRTGLRREPTPGISTSITSPSWRNRGGSWLAPTPAGVPVRMTVPAGSVVPRLRSEMSTDTGNSMSEVDAS